MKQSVVFVANGFNKENARLQPWRYVYELAISQSADSRVYIITEGNEENQQEQWDDGFTVIQTRYLSVSCQSKLKTILLSINPGEIWWSTTPRTLAFYKLLSSLNCRLITYITCPLYTWNELSRASIAGVPFGQTKALWQQRLIPRTLFRWLLNRHFIDRIFVQSEKNRSILINLGVNQDKLGLIPVGIDVEDARPADQALVSRLKQEHGEINGKMVYLYFGALRTIRGFDALLAAFSIAVKQNPDMHLIILARGASEVECGNLESELNIKGIHKHITLVGGWLSKEEVWAYIEISDVAVLPFVLVPSDIPIAVLEAMARGKPVMVSHVDGLPELAKGRGVIIDPLNTDEFSGQLNWLSRNVEHRKKLGQAAQKYMKNYPRWSDVGDIIKNTMH